MQQERIKALDGLRAFAIIFVLFSHSTWKYSAQVSLKIGSADLHNLLYNGWMGVDLFFVLSGFLISSQLLNKKLSKDTLYAFAARRFFRIAPAYYVAILITLFAYYILPELGAQSVSALMQYWGFAVFAHVIFLHDYIGREPSINGLFWSIPVEIKFYLLLPLVILFVTKIKSRSKQALAVAAFFCFYVLAKTLYAHSTYDGQSMSYTDYFLLLKTPFHLSWDGLIVGVFCGFLLNYEKVDALKNVKAMNGLFVAGLLLFLLNGLSPHFTNDTASFFEQTLMTSLFALSFGLVLIALVTGCFATSFFTNPFLAFIAKISYSMYLTHIFAISAQSWLIAHIEHYITSPTLCWLISLPFFFVLACGLAYILHITIENPFIAWSKQKFKYANP